MAGLTADSRSFVNAVFGIPKRAPWRDVPQRFGNRNSVQRRFNRRAPKGGWDKVSEVLQDEDLEGCHRLPSWVSARRSSLSPAWVTKSGLGMRGERLLESDHPEAVIAEKGCDSRRPVAFIEGRGAETVAVIPPRSNRTETRDYDRHLDKTRNPGARFIGRIKRFRRVATRCEKAARNVPAFLHVAAVMDLLRWSAQIGSTRLEKEDIPS